MNFIKGYKPIPYKELQKDLKRVFDESGKSLIDLAAAAEVTTTNTASSAINAEDQVVSDRVLTNIFQCLNFGAFILWINGEKYYFVKSKT